MTYNTIDYWKNRIKSYGHVNTTPPEREDVKEIEKELIQKYVKNGSFIIDYGVGGGRMFPLYNEKELNVYGFDIADFTELIEKQREKYDNFNYTHKISDSVSNTEFETDSFDACICFAVLLHQTPDNIKQVINEICRVAKIVIISTYYPLVEIPLDKHCFYYNYEKLFSELEINVLEEIRTSPEIVFYVINKK